jgi:Luciferase
MSFNKNLIDEIVREVSGWNGVSAFPHRFGGTEFLYGKPEIGHIHNNGLTDIPFTIKIRDVLVKEQIVYPHHILPDTGWVSYYVRKKEDAETAIRLFRLSYLRYVIKRENDISSYKGEIENLKFPESIKHIFKDMFKQKISHPDAQMHRESK